MNHQFYPTPPSLAQIALAKFENNRVIRLLEPSAGRAHLADAAKDYFGSRFHSIEIDTIEIDFDNQAILRNKKYRVVGHDFLQYRGAALYSHILLNPPFAEGVAHILHAWDLLFDGEIVAILNAETVRNPHTRERKFLLDLIEQHGDVEYHQDAFMTEDTLRTTAVDIALVHLKKSAHFKAEFLDDLKRDKVPADDKTFTAPTDLIVSNRELENRVLSFNNAVTASRDAIFAKVRATYYKNMLGKSILDETTDSDNDYYKDAAKDLNTEYQDLKERAWSSILRSAQVTDKLSSSAQKRLEADFAQVSQLEFTSSNIAAFLVGLVQQQGQIQLDMMSDVFDLIGKYHYDNRCYYQGWKSNARHRVNAFRIMMTRFIIPSCDRGHCSWSSSLDWNDRQRFRDLDKVFALLDGKNPVSVSGLEDLFDREMNALRAAERMQSDYFDVRFYRHTGTFHLYPRRKDLIDRLNRTVGKQRNWLPQQEAEASSEFWQQYDKAEKIKRTMRIANINMWDLQNGEDSRKNLEHEKLLAAHTAALDKLGIEFDPSRVLVHRPPTPPVKTLDAYLA